MKINNETKIKVGYRLNFQRQLLKMIVDAQLLVCHIIKTFNSVGLFCLPHKNAYLLTME